MAEKKKSFIEDFTFYADPEKSEKEAKARADKDEEYVKRLDTNRKLWGGSKKSSGAAGMGASDDQVKEAGERLERSRKDLQSVQEYRRKKMYDNPASKEKD